MSVPTDCWYVVATADGVTRGLRSVRVLDRPVLLYRTRDGRPVALEDRCAHRAYPLSAGRLVDAGAAAGPAAQAAAAAGNGANGGDDVQCGLCGFVYAADGQCVAVPTQSRVPFGASVASYPVREQDGLVWAWFGEPGRARLARVPELGWLTADGWATVAGQGEVAADYLLLHESFADVTQVPFVAPDIAPAALSGRPGQEPPPLDVVVTETTVTLRRDFPPAPLPGWQAPLLRADAADLYSTTQVGLFVSPAAWVDHWDVTGRDGRAGRLRFSQLVTPVGPGRSRVLWRVSRDFAVDDPQAGQVVAEVFEGYYRRVMAAMETAQAVLDLDGPGPEVNVSADVAALKVREIVALMLAEQGAAPVRATHRTPSATLS